MPKRPRLHGDFAIYMTPSSSILLSFLPVRFVTLKASPKAGKKKARDKDGARRGGGKGGDEKARDTVGDKVRKIIRLECAAAAAAKMEMKARDKAWRIIRLECAAAAVRTHGRTHACMPIFSRHLPPFEGVRSDNYA